MRYRQRLFLNFFTLSTPQITRTYIFQSDAASFLENTNEILPQYEDRIIRQKFSLRVFKVSTINQNIKALREFKNIRLLAIF